MPSALYTEHDERGGGVGGVCGGLFKVHVHKSNKQGKN